jgi:DNA/RNA endonuclease G (NUC1)
MVAEIGYSQLTPACQATVKKYLGTISVPNAGTWMDDVRNNTDYAYMKPWHFINIDKGEQYKPSDDPNVVNEINNAITNLNNRENLSDEEVRLNILALFHLIGDVAQPLHDGYGSDKGGNDVAVTYLGKKSNLHKVWDSEIIESEGITKERCEARLDKLSEEQKDHIRIIDPVVWMKDSRRLLDKVYTYENKTIDQDYVTRNAKVIEKQVLYAGMRLAATLESIFGKATPVAVAKAATLPNGVVTLKHTYYTSHFSTALHIPWVVEYTLRKKDVDCANPVKRVNKFAPDPLNVAATDLDKDYAKSGYDRGHNMPAADNACNGITAMNECFYFSNMFPQTHRLNAGVWKTLEERERDMAAQDDSIYVWIGNYGIEKTIGANEVAVPKYCWKVIYDYKTKEWSAYMFPNTLTVAGKPEDFETTVQDIEKKSGYVFK